MHYQKPLLEDAAITQLPQTFEQSRRLTVALKPPVRRGLGISGRPGSAIFASFAQWLYTSGGGRVNFDTGEVLTNNPAPILAKPIFAALALMLHTGPPEFLPGQKSAKQTLDDVAADWQRAIGRAGGLK